MPKIHPLMAVLNIKTVLKFWLCVLLAFCVSANAEYSLNIDNKLAACVSVESVTIDGKAAIPTIELLSKPKQLTAECGCKSRLNAYHSYIDNGDSRSFLMSGHFSFVDNESTVLPLAAQSVVVGDNQSFILSIACANPQ